MCRHLCNGSFQAVELALAFFQFHLRLQLFQRQFRRPAVFAGFLGFLLNVGNVFLDRFAGLIFPGASSWRDLCFQDPLLG